MADSYDEMYAHLDVSFYNGTKLHKRKTLEARAENPGAAEVYVDQEMVAIKFPGMKDSMHAPAHSPCAQAKLSDGSHGGFITYAQKFHKHYDHWKEHGDVAMVMGTPIEQATFLTKGQVESLKSLKILSIEQLATVDERATKQIGPHALGMIDHAKEFVASKTDVSAVMNEMERLKAELAELKGQPAAEPAPAVDGEGDKFAGMDEEALKAYIKDKSGHAPRGRPTLDTLKRMARDADAGVAA